MSSQIYFENFIVNKKRILKINLFTKKLLFKVKNLISNLDFFINTFLKGFFANSFEKSYNFSSLNYKKFYFYYLLKLDYFKVQFDFIILKLQKNDKKLIFNNLISKIKYFLKIIKNNKLNILWFRKMSYFNFYIKKIKDNFKKNFVNKVQSILNNLKFCYYH